MWWRVDHSQLPFYNVAQKSGESHNPAGLASGEGEVWDFCFGHWKCRFCDTQNCENWPILQCLGVPTCLKLSHPWQMSWTCHGTSRLPVGGLHMSTRLLKSAASRWRLPSSRFQLQIFYRVELSTSCHCVQPAACDKKFAWFYAGQTWKLNGLHFLSSKINQIFQCHS